MATITAEDREFLRAFEECTVAKSCWTHEAHVRMAWIVLNLEAGYGEGLARIRKSIQRLNSAVESTGYHETLTVAFTQLIQYRRQLGDSTWSYEEFLRNNEDLAVRSPLVLARNYSSELLAQPASKGTFVAPDRRDCP